MQKITAEIMGRITFGETKNDTGLRPRFKIKF